MLRGFLQVKMTLNIGSLLKKKVEAYSGPHKEHVSRKGPFPRFGAKLAEEHDTCGRAEA